MQKTLLPSKGAIPVKEATLLHCKVASLRGSEGRSPPSCIPNPATCAVDSEALRSKVSLRVSPAALKAQGKRVLSEKIAVGELFRQAGAGGNARFFIFI